MRDVRPKPLHASRAASLPLGGEEMWARARFLRVAWHPHGCSPTLTTCAAQLTHWGSVCAAALLRPPAGVCHTRLPRHGESNNIDQLDYEQSAQNKSTSKRCCHGAATASPVTWALCIPGAGSGPVPTDPSQPFFAAALRCTWRCVSNLALSCNSGGAGAAVCVPRLASGQLLVHGRRGTVR